MVQEHNNQFETSIAYTGMFSIWHDVQLECVMGV